MQRKQYAAVGALCRHEDVCLTLHSCALHCRSYTPTSGRTITMFEARLMQGSLLKKIIEAIKDLVTDANFDCTENDFSLQAMDSSHVSLVAMTLEKDGFEHFRCDKAVSMGMQSVYMLPALCRAVQFFVAWPLLNADRCLQVSISRGCPRFSSVLEMTTSLPCRPRTTLIELPLSSKAPVRDLLTLPDPPGGMHSVWLFLKEAATGDWLLGQGCCVGQVNSPWQAYIHRLFLQRTTGYLISNSS